MNNPEIFTKTIRSIIDNNKTGGGLQEILNLLDSTIINNNGKKVTIVMTIMLEENHDG